MYLQGDTLETGHYTAACKNPYDHQWYKFDDQRVNVVPNDKVQEEIVNNEAYILFYQRRKIDSAECSGSNSSSSEHWLSKMTLPPNPGTTEVKLCSEVKSEEAQNPAESLDKHVAEIKTPTITHENKEIQTDECAVAVKTEDTVKETTPPPEECEPNDANTSPPATTATPISLTEVPVKVEPTNEDEIIDIESLDAEKPIEAEIVSPSTSSESTSVKEDIEEDEATIATVATSPIKIEEKEEKKTNGIVSLENDIDIEVELRNLTIKKSEGALSMSFPTQRSIWPFENHHNTIHTYTPILSRGSLNFNELLSSERNAHLRHSLSTSLGQKRSSTNSDKAKLISVTANDTLAMVRGVSSCSKDTLIYIDQQTRHRSLMDEENNFLSNQPLWVNLFT